MGNSSPQASSDSKSFSSFNWMRGVAEDHRITEFRRLTLLRLFLFRNGASGRCDPSYDTVAKVLDVDRVTVIRAVEDGQRYGWLAPPTRRGPTSNLFMFTFPVGWTTEKEVAPERHQDAEEVAPERHHSDEEVAPEYKRSRSRARKKSLPSNPNGSMNGIRERGSIYDAPDDASLDLRGGSAADRSKPPAKPEPEPDADDELRAAFSEFKSVYPRKDGLDAAFPEYRRAAKRTNTDFINNRAEVYGIIEQARIESSRDPQRQRGFTMLAKNWLKDGRYNDPAPDGAVFDQNGLVVSIEGAELDDAGISSDNRVRNELEELWRVNDLAGRRSS